MRARWRKAATGGISADDLKPSIARLTGMAERIDRALQESPWLAGDEYSLADIDIAPFVQRLVRIDLFGLVAARPRVNDWYEVSFTRHFYKPQPLRTLEEISADILAIEKEAEGLLDGLLKVGVKS